MALIDRLIGRTSPEQVVRDHGPAVARQLRRIFGPRADIDDVYQAVFVEVLRSLPTFSGRAQLSTWIHRIALNVSFQEMRLRYRERSARADGDLDAVPAEGIDAELGALKAESVRLLYEGLEQLDPKKRIAVILHDIEGLTLREVSEMLGRPLQTVASQVRFGRAELAAFFQRTEAAPAAARREAVGR